MIIPCHDDVMKLKHFPRYWPFVRGIHRSPVNSPHKGQWREALIFSLIGAWINGWVNNREAGDLRRHRAHYDVIVMWKAANLNTVMARPLFSKTIKLTHLNIVPHICVSESGRYWLRLWLVAYSAPSHYLNQCCGIVDWTLRNKLQWNYNQNTKFFIRENASEYIAKCRPSSPGADELKRCGVSYLSLSGVPDYFGRNKISSGGDLSHYSSASLY